MLQRAWIQTSATSLAVPSLPPRVSRDGRRRPLEPSTSRRRQKHATRSGLALARVRYQAVHAALGITSLISNPLRRSSGDSATALPREHHLNTPFIDHLTVAPAQARAQELQTGPSSTRAPRRLHGPALRAAVILARSSEAPGTVPSQRTGDAHSDAISPMSTGSIHHQRSSGLTGSNPSNPEERGKYDAPRPCQRTPCDAHWPPSTEKRPSQITEHTPMSAWPWLRGGSLIAPQSQEGYRV